MRLVERFTSDSDRLVTALFVAALLHGLVILGVRFASPSAANALPTLEVLLVAEGPEQEANLDASYIAQRNQRGSGTTPDRAQPSLPEPSLGFSADAGDAAGEPPAPDIVEQTPGNDSALSARTAGAQRALAGSDQANRAARPPLTLQSRPQVAVDVGATLPELVLRGDTMAGAELLADTRASQIARYLHGWKLRIEQVGTLNFPNEARRRSLSGNPVLEVAIAADGQLDQVIVRRSSGHPELDQAAVNIVRLASPFDPFPAAMRKSYPVLRFAYEWQFLEGRLGGGSVTSGQP
jgi:periplasmic protein TonB